jgi:hypothetical protein
MHEHEYIVLEGHQALRDVRVSLGVSSLRLSVPRVSRLVGLYARASRGYAVPVGTTEQQVTQGLYPLHYFKIRSDGYTTRDATQFRNGLAMAKMLGPSHPGTNARCTAMMIRPCKPRDLPGTRPGRRCRLQYVTDGQVTLALHPPERRRGTVLP